MAAEPQPELARLPSVRRVLTRTLVALLVAFAFAAIAGRMFRPELEALGRGFVARFGYFGMFLGTFIADGLSFPVPPWFYFVLSIASGASQVETLLVVCAGSALGAFVAYALSSRVCELRLFRARIAAARERLAPFIARHGAWAMIAMSFVPLPFSLSCYVMGSYRVGGRLFGLYVLLRVPRLLVFYAMVRLGLQ